MQIFDIIALIGGFSGIATGISYIINVRTHKRKETALTYQEKAKVDLEKANALDKTGDIYYKMTQHVEWDWMDVVYSGIGALIGSLIILFL